MGLEWGQIAHLRGIITYKVSPYALNPFAGILSHGVLNVVRRTRNQMFYILPPLILGLAIYDYGITENAKSKRKNPKDYENDV